MPFLPGSGARIDTGLVRTTLSALIGNSEGRYNPGPEGLVWWTRPLLARFGIEVSAGSWDWVDLPLLWPDEPELDLAERVVRVDARDALRLIASDSRIGTPVVFAAGSRLDAAIRALLVAVGAVDVDASFDLDDGGAAFSAEHTYESGALVGSVIGQLLTDYRLDLYAAPPAVYTMRPLLDPLTTDPVATWALGRDVRRSASASVGGTGPRTTRWWRACRSRASRSRSTSTTGTPAPR